jgi:hypothetical protein
VETIGVSAKRRPRAAARTARRYFTPHSAR